MVEGMTWPLWVVVLVLAIGMIANISHVGKDRNPLKASDAARASVFSLLLIVLVFLGS